MAILALDFGGSAIKYGVWTEDGMAQKSSIPLPETWERMLQKLASIKKQFEEQFEIEGIAVSVPGAVDQKNDQILGTTAISYIHQRKFTQELSQHFSGLPVHMENDANCAALSEIWQGEAKETTNSLFLVFGTGVGGAIISNRKVHSGQHFFGGEFGYMFLNEEKTFSELASIVLLTKRYEQMTGNRVDGPTLFALAEKGDHLADALLTEFFRYAARGIYNLIVSFDPDKIILGGAISKNQRFVEEVNNEIKKLKARSGATALMSEVAASRFGNEANLIGAVYNYLLNEER